MHNLVSQRFNVFVASAGTSKIVVFGNLGVGWEARVITGRTEVQLAGCPGFGLDTHQERVSVVTPIPPIKNLDFRGSDPSKL